jgi:hypothetical protein
VVARPLVGGKEVWPVWQHVRNLDGATHGDDRRDAIVESLGRFKAGERIGPRIESGVVEDGRKSAGVEALAVRPSIAKRAVERVLAGGRVVDAAVDQEAVIGLLTLLIGRLGNLGRACGGAFRLLAVCRCCWEPGPALAEPA